jgi:hypothetical protein
MALFPLFALDTCTAGLDAASNLSCFAALIGTDVYYFGDEPIGFEALLQAAIAAGGNFGVSGLVGISGTGVTADTVVVPADGEPSDDLTQMDTDDNVPAGAQAPTDDGEIGGGDGNNFVGTAIGVSAAGLAVVLLVLLVAGRRRRSGTSKAEGIEHRQLTADEDDDPDMYAREVGPDAYFGATDDSSYDYPDDEGSESVIIWDGDEEDGIQAIYSEPAGENILTPEQREALENHSCSSPSCRICEMKNQEGVGVTFVQATTPRSFDFPTTLSPDARRNYVSEDTVDL